MIRLPRKVITIVLFALGISVFLALWLAAGQLIAPKRRDLQAYHYEWLNSPAAHGMILQRFTAMDGKVPCMLVTPDAIHGPGERGKRLRQQLSESTAQLSPYGAVQGTMVLLHGRKGRKEDLLPVAERFCAVGFRCILPDLPAHGESPVETVHFATSDVEAKLPEAVLSEASTQFGFPQKPAVLWGMSMGGAFAIRSAAVSPQRWSALIVVSSFDSLSGVIDGQLHWAGPAIPILRNAVAAVTALRGGLRLANARPVDWASAVKIPVLVAHGDRDTLIPLERGKTLFDSFGSPNKRWIPVESGDHNRVLVTPMPLYAKMAEWLIGTSIFQKQTGAVRQPGASHVQAGEITEALHSRVLNPTSTPPIVRVPAVTPLASQQP
ncbi:alpha/beta hydrolase [Verrucomicrobiota bacterium sgz303538]